MKKQDKNQKEYSKELLELLDRGNKDEVRAVFSFTIEEQDEEIAGAFNVWSKHFYPKFFKEQDAQFHKDIILNLVRLYKGDQAVFLDIAFRGAGKTTLTKLFVAFVIANDLQHFRRYIKVLSADGSNAKQIVTDVYNLLINKTVLFYYPEIFEKTEEKRQETMSTFTTATGVKMQSDTVGTDQRGDIQEDARPDFIWCDDFETRKTLRSAVITQAIWDNMEEAKTGLSKAGVILYNCNYVSERGNVHKLVEKFGQYALITPIKKDGKPIWDAYTIEEINEIERNADDFAGEYMCEPGAGDDIMIDRASVDKQVEKTPVREIAGFKMFHDYDPSHRYAGAHDIAGGVGLDSSTSVFMDFSTVPARVVATFKSNTVKPDTFGDEIAHQGRRYGECLLAPESNNHGHATIGRLKQIYPLEKIYSKEVKQTKVVEAIGRSSLEYGYNTNALTKPKDIFDFKKAIEDGLVELSDADLKAEARAYSRDDLMDKDVDVRLTTRHFDLFRAACICWQMRNHAKQVEPEETYQQDPYERSGLES